MARNRIWTIARWEYLQKIRSKGFILSLLITPLMIVAFGVLPGLLVGQGPDEVKVVGVVDRTGSIFNPLKERMEKGWKLKDGQPAYVLVNYVAPGRTPDSALAEADRDALEERIEGAIIINDSAGIPRVTYRSTNPNDLRLLSAFESTIERLNTERHLREIGVDTAVYYSIARTIDIEPMKVTRQGEEGAGGFLATLIAGYAGSFLLMFLILTTGQSLVRSLVEEKSNRIMELLVGTCTPRELMWGKLVGLSGLGFTQLFVWGILGLGAATVFATSSGVDTWLRNIYALLPAIGAYMLLGYFFYAALFIGVGSLVTTEQEAQIMTSYLAILLVLPMAFMAVVVQSPDTGYIKVLSFIPLFTPSLMMIRIVTKMPPLWELLTTMGILLLSTAIVVRVAGRVFRIAILMYGKRPSFGEIMRWMRNG